MRYCSPCFLTPLLAMALSSCAQVEPMTLKQSACMQPRPQACTRQYSPVCAILRDSSRKTFSNRCQACSELTVIATTPGACPGKK